ncbi:MAG: molybdopterin molybdotransferase MoeA [Zavarzinella sp.]
MLTVDQAVETILTHAHVGREVRRTLADPCVGCVLAEPVISDIDSPPMTKALMDGFALRSADCTSANAQLHVVEEIPAGKVSEKTIQQGQAARIMTGAAMPSGADAVIPIEYTTMVSNLVTIQRSVPVGQHVLPQGAEMRVGQTVLARGTKLLPQELGILATVGKADFLVYESPTVGILTTGSEVVSPSEFPPPGKIRNSNGSMLFGQIHRAGGVPRMFPHVGDDRTALSHAIANALEQSDILLITGGMSVGAYDYTPEVLQEQGVTAYFHKIIMKPGRPLLFGTLGEKMIFGLPGNPVSSFVCFELFVRTAIARFRGLTNPELPRVELPLAGNLAVDHNRPTYAPGVISIINEKMVIQPLEWFGSADLQALSQANALLELPAGKTEKQLGEHQAVLLLQEL